MGNKSKWTLVGLALVALGLGLLLYWRHATRYPSTSDAYLQAHVVQIAPQVGGEVAVVPVRNNQRVRAGDLLLAIDPAPYRIALERAQAQLDSTRQEVAAAQSDVDAAQAQVGVRQSALTQAKQEVERVVPLVKKGLLPPSQGDDTNDALRQAEAQLQSARAQLQATRRRLGRLGGDNAQIRAAEAAVAQAGLDLKHTRITAPADGRVAGLETRPGTVVEANRPLFALVESREWWVDANYEETSLTRIRPGQRATITVDIYPDRTFHGVVESVSPASGVAFSLLPPENATGNWVKVTQRFPVRVRIIDPDPGHPLRVGASAEVTIDTVHGGESGGGG